MRRENLSTILQLVHSRKRISRAEMTRATGLNRSTVADLVTELTGLGLVFESEPAASNRAGRPSPIVTATRRAVAIAVNPEIDAVTIGTIALDGTVLQRIRYRTEHSPTPSEVVEITAAVIDGMKLGFESHDPVGIGVAVPGLVDAGGGIVKTAPHLGWQNVPLARMVEEATGFRTRVANDASLGALAESVFGAGRGVADLVYLNGGPSGIGGGVIAGGSPLAGAAGYAGEFGHTLVNSSGLRCRCGAIGCLETEVDRERLIDTLAAGAGMATEREWFEGGLGDADNEALLVEGRRQLGFLAVALRNITNALNPRLIVLGGFLGSLYAIDPGYLDGLLGQQALHPPLEHLRVCRTELGSDLLMIGAAELAFVPLLADPAGRTAGAADGGGRGGQAAVTEAAG